MLLTLTAFWYFYAQKETLFNVHFYKMQHTADQINSEIISSHMLGKAYTLSNRNGFNISTYDTQKRYIEGHAEENIDFKKNYYYDGKTTFLVSTGSNNHLGVHFLVLSSKSLSHQINELTVFVSIVWLIVILTVFIIGWWLSRLFLKPIQNKIVEIETFIKDMTHELNTPITALLLSSKRLRDRKVYDEKSISNISISSKQLLQMYEALSYSSFTSQEFKDEVLDISQICSESLDFFNELLERKNINIKSDLKPCYVSIDKYKASMLFNNILSNAIKYSYPSTCIEVSVDEKKISIKDEGIGISKEKIDGVFERFNRASDYAGGFGIGLSVVKRICDDYGFDVSITSIEGEGTEIKILLKNGNV